jgi:acetyl esterase
LQNETQASNPHVSPLLAEDHSRLPPALIITCGFDRLRDEGKTYADKLGAAGVDVSHSCYTGMNHGFISFGGFLQQGQAARKHCAAALLEAFA